MFLLLKNFTVSGHHQMLHQICGRPTYLSRDERFRIQSFEDRNSTYNVTLLILLIILMFVFLFITHALLWLPAWNFLSDYVVTYHLQSFYFPFYPDLHTSLLTTFQMCLELVTLGWW